MVIVLREYKDLGYNYSILLLFYSDQHLCAYIATCHTHFSNEGCHFRNLKKQYAPMQ